MAIYKFRLFGDGGKVVAVQRISALTDSEALSIAHAMIEGAPIATFELWQDQRRVHVESKKNCAGEGGLSVRQRGQLGNRKNGNEHGNQS